jgi:drug/metabolite transporter (DMT)-like permease
MRFTIACLLLFIYLKYHSISFPMDIAAWRFMLVTGLMQFFLNYALLFWGEQYITSGLAAVLQSTIPIFGLILARIHLNERISLVKVLSLLLGCAGVCIIFYDQLSVNGIMAFWGSLAVVVGGFCAAWSSVLTKQHGMHHHIVALMLGQMLVGQTALWITGLLGEGNPMQFSWTGKAWWCILYLACIGSIAAFGIYYWLLKRIEASQSMMISLVTPLFAVFIGTFFNESLPAHTIMGGVFIVGSIACIVFRRQLEQLLSAR